MLPILEDNFCYYVYDDQNGFLVDVGCESISAYCNENQLFPSAILSTHWHSDHTGGNKSMKTLNQSLKIYGGELDNVS